MKFSLKPRMNSSNVIAIFTLVNANPACRACNFTFEFQHQILRGTKVAHLASFAK